MAIRLLLIFFLCSASIAKAQTTIVHFEFNSATLTPETEEILNQFLTSRNIRTLGIFGHTDQVGTEDYNLWLSIERARRVRDYLLSHGLAANKVGIVRGYGTERLISNSNDEMSRQLNRRVVLMNGYKPLDNDSELSVKHLAMRKPNQNAPADKPVIAKTPVQQQATAQPATIIKEQPIVKQQRNEKLIEDIKDKSTKAGENIVLKNINFYAGSHEFLPIANRALEDLAEAMQKISTLEIEIQGHVCCQDGEADALDNATGELSLSVNRAKAVYDFLLQKELIKTGLVIKALHQYPLIKMEVTEADRIANRRVEIKIIKK